MNKLVLVLRYVFALGAVVISIAPVVSAAVPQMPNTTQSTACISALLTPLPGGIALPKIELDSNKIPYFVFQNLEQAQIFLNEAYNATRNRLDIRAEYLVPAMNGLREIYRKTDTQALNGKIKMEIRAVLTAWYNTVEQTEGTNLQLDNQSLENIYELAVRFAGSDLFTLNHITAYSNFSQFYGSLNRQPPQKQLKKWLDNYLAMISISTSYNVLINSLKMLPVLSLSDFELAHLTKIWLKQEALLDAAEVDLSRKTYALNKLYLIDPNAAYTYFMRHKSDFLNLKHENSHWIVQPITYFKYVMQKTFSGSDIDINFLKEIFAEYNIKISSTENKVGDMLSSYGIKFDQTVLDPLAPFIELDFLVKLEDGRRINIEVDGPHHFIKDSDGTLRQRRADRRRDEILKALGIEVYRIPYFELDANPSAVEDRLMQFLIK